MDASQYANADDAIASARANLSPRAIELENLERYAIGTQYEGRPSFFDDSKPLWERAPCVVYPIVQIAIESNRDLVLGSHRFPIVSSNPGEDDSEADGLDEEKSQRVDRAIAELQRRVRWKAVSRQALVHAEQARSAAAIIGARNGRPFIELIRSRWCEPTFDVHGKVSKLEIRYPYLQPEKQADGRWKLKPLIYRRVIDSTSDTTFLPMEANSDGREPQGDAWKVDPKRTVEHKLGFCPVHWYAHLRECSDVADFDGQAIHETVLDEIQGLDFALSQRHRAAIFAGDPQTIETGVQPGYNPSGVTARTSVPSTNAAGQVTGAFQSPQPQAARKKSPGVVWQYESPETKVSYLILPPEALNALSDNAADLRNKLAEALAVVLIDPQNAKFTSDMSGRAIEQLRARQFDRCDIIRDDLEDNWLLPVTLLLVRVALATKLPIPAVQAVAKDLKAYISDDEARPMLFVRWPGGYIKPTAKDESDTVTATGAARTAKIITRRMAVQKVASIFGVDNVDQAVEALEQEDDEGAAKLHQAVAALGGSAAGADDSQGTDGDPSDGAAGATGAKAGAPTDGGAPPAAKASPSASAAGRGSVAARPSSLGSPRAPQSPASAADPATISQAGASTSGVTQSLYDQLAEDFPPEAIAWVRAARVEGPIAVPIDQIDFGNREEWQADDEPARVASFKKRIESGNRKPIVLVNEPNNEKLIIVDGHHRALAYEELGQPAIAYVVHVTAVSGPWDEMHDSQKSGPSNRSAA